MLELAELLCRRHDVLRKRIFMAPSMGPRRHRQFLRSIYNTHKKKNNSLQTNCCTFEWAGSSYFPQRTLDQPQRHVSISILKIYSAQTSIHIYKNSTIVVRVSSLIKASSRFGMEECPVIRISFSSESVLEVTMVSALRTEM